MKSRKLTDKETFVFAEPAHDLNYEPPETDESVIAERLFGKQTPGQMIDAFERQVGLQQPKTEKLNWVYKVVMLSGEDEEDMALYCQLLNDQELYPRHTTATSWTARGEYKMFVTYAEDLNVRAARLKKKELEHEQS